MAGFLGVSRRGDHDLAGGVRTDDAAARTAGTRNLWSVDPRVRKVVRLEEPASYWAAHQCDLPYSRIERRVKLGSLPATGFKVSCLPLKIRRGSAGPARVVAIPAD